MEFKTERYKITIEELSEGGPGGYESVYLNREGDKATPELYNVLNGFQGKLLPAANRMIRQRNGNALVEALRTDKSVGIASGFRPSGAFHFGHGLTSSTVAFFQKNGAQIFIPVADIEARLAGISEEVYSYLGADNLLDWGANGVNLDAAHVYLQSEEFRGFSLVPYTVKESSFNLPFDIYGIEKTAKDFPFIIAGIIQVSDITLPQYKDFGNYHSFMISGQDQDGHMKMTYELTKRALERGDIQRLGIQTVPSGFYIPHIRGISGDKASSSKAAGTLYLGSGPEKEDLTERIRTTLRKVDGASAEDLEKCALDMVRYIDFFNARSGVSFEELSASEKYGELQEKLEIAKTREEQKAAQHEIDSYLIGECKAQRQDNVGIVRDSLLDALAEHQKKREAILCYAKARASYLSQGGWSMDDNKPLSPKFWKVPERAVVDEHKRNATQWFNIIDKVADKIIP